MKEKEIELYGMTLAELDTEVEVAKSAEVDEYVKTLKWSPDTDDYTKTLIIGNIRGFAFRKTTPETPINGFINKLAQRFAEVSAREARLVEALERLRDCDWVISLPDRMDAVREIAREALAKYRGEK